MSKPGYKNTELGWIPVEWDVKKYEDICLKFINGGTPSTNVEKYWNGNIPWITGADILNNEIGIIRRYINTEAVKESSTNIIQRGCLLIVTRTGVGKIAIATFDIAISQDFTGVYPNSKYVLTKYLFYSYLNCSEKTKSLNQGTSINGITRDTLKSIKLPLPPLPEQKKIAEILSTWDKAISNYELQITNYEKLKKGLMQKLFSTKEWDRKGIEWKETRLMDVVSYEQPTNYIVSSTEYDNNNKIPVLTAGKSFILGYTNESDGIYSSNLPVIIFDDFTTTNNFVNFPFKVKSSAMKILKPKNNINIRFIYEVMQHIKFEIGDSHKRFWISEYQYLKIHLPNYEVQCNFASIIETQVKMIELSKKHLEALKQQKKGLMQKLLIGEVRVRI